MMNNDRYLFRGKRLYSKEWIQGYYSRNAEGSSLLYVPYNNYEVDPATVGQCTGLRDKNGTLIFEGDIVNDHMGANGLVKWDNECSRYMVHSEVRGAKYVGYVGRDDKPTVIGNIHDNPELLEVGDEKRNS